MATPSGQAKPGYGGNPSGNPKTQSGDRGNAALAGDQGDDPGACDELSTSYPLQRSGANNRSNGSIPAPITRRTYQGSRSANKKG